MSKESALVDHLGRGTIPLVLIGKSEDLKTGIAVNGFLGSRIPHFSTTGLADMVTSYMVFEALWTMQYTN